MAEENFVIPIFSIGFRMFLARARVTPQGSPMIPNHSDNSVRVKIEQTKRKIVRMLDFDLV